MRRSLTAVAILIALLMTACAEDETETGPTAIHVRVDGMVQSLGIT